jgi:hypothetical protein
MDSQQCVVLVGRYLTPLALGVGGLAVVFGSAGAERKIVVTGLLAFAAFFNYKFPSVHARQASARRGGAVQFRLFLNFAVNAAVVFLLGEAFPPLWLLLTLTPLAAAVYGHPRESWITAAVAAGLLMGVQVFRPGSAPVDFAAQAARGGFIVLLTLLINAVSRHVRE